jgi:hypothetical protein
MDMITYDVKDKILEKLVKVSPDMLFELNIFDSLNVFGNNDAIVSAVLDYFENNGLIHQDKSLGGEVNINILVPAHDLVAHGGFKVQEELLQKNIEKLLLEIENLKPSIPDKVETITTIAANIASALGFFLTR